MPVVDIGAVTESFSGLDAHFGIDEFIFSAQVEKIKHSWKADTFDGSGLGTSDKNSHVGIREGDLELDGFAAMRPGEFSDILYQRFGRSTASKFWYTPGEGLDAGDPIIFQLGRIYDSSIDIATDDVVKTSVKAGSAGLMAKGGILLSPAGLLPGASGTSAILDNTAGGGQSNFGAAAFLHVYAIDGGTTPALTVTLEHCDTSAGTYTEIGEFAAATAPGAWHIKIPSVTPVKAFVRATWAVTGAPAALQAMCNFGRLYSRTA